MSDCTSHPVVCFGEILWDMLPSGKQAGGAPMNVAHNLQILGKNPAVISKIGFDELGEQLIDHLTEKGICTDYIQLDNSHPTSIVTAIAKNPFEMSYTIVENVAWDYIEPQSELVSLVQAADYFVFGSLAARCAQTYITLKELLRSARHKVFDVNLRTPYFDRPLIEELLEEANIVKLNEDELQLVGDWYSSSGSEAERVGFLKERFGITLVVVTRGAKGAALYTPANDYTCNGLPVQVADTVGSGDAFLAGILSQLIDGAAPEQALHFANRLAAFITMQNGACANYRLSDIHSFFFTEKEPFPNKETFIA